MGMIRYCDHCGRSSSEAGEIKFYRLSGPKDPVAVAADQCADLCQDCYNEALSIFTATKKWDKSHARIYRKTYHFWSDEENAKVMEMWNRNCSVNEIARAIGVTIPAIASRIYYLRKEGKLK